MHALFLGRGMGHGGLGIGDWALGHPGLFFVYNARGLWGPTSSFDFPTILLASIPNAQTFEPTLMVLRCSTRSPINQKRRKRHDEVYHRHRMHYQMQPRYG